MKKIFTLLNSIKALGLVLFLLPNLVSGQIAAWDFFAQSSPATFAATTFNANLVSASNASNITRGSGAASSTASNSFRTTGFQNNGISTANTDYFQVTLTANNGYRLSLSTIDARLAGTASFTVSPGVSSQFAYSLNGSTFTLIGSSQATIGTPATLTQISLTGISALQNVAAGTTITLRYYASGQTTTGGWGFNSPAAGQNGLAIAGTLDVVLSTELTHLLAKTTEERTTLTWRTASETNNAAFNIERSTNGVDFSTIGNVKGNGTTNATSNYTFEDATPAVGTNYYRLRQIDFDGTETLSKVVSVQFNGNGKSKGLKVYPTLASDKLNVVVESDKAETFNIINLLGQTVLTGRLTNATEINISALAKGTYMLQVAGDIVKFAKN